MDDTPVPAGTPPVPAPEPAPEAPSWASQVQEGGETDMMALARTARESREREAEMKKVADLGQKRFLRERAIKQKLKDDAEARAKRAQAGMSALAERKEEKKEGAKEYRKQYRQREKEIAEDKKRKEQFRLELEAKQKARQEARKKQAQYMEELRLQAAIKREQELKKLHKADEYDRRTHAAERKFHMRLQELERIRARAVDEAVVAYEARKGVIDKEMQQEIYKCETAHRMRMQAMDAELRGKLNGVWGPRAAENERKKADIQAQYRPRYQKVEKEFAERRAGIEMNARIQKAAAENDCKTAKFRAEENLRAQKHKAETDYGRELEDIARGIH